MPIEIKIARICWNTDRWIKPSGPLGKSKNHDSYEFNYGFGHEEWLLDTTKLINGYHYGYLQAIGQHREKYIGHTAFSTSKSYLIVGMLVQDILFTLGLTEYPFLSYFFKDENAVHKNRIILVKT